MFINSDRQITDGLKNISLKVENNMHPKSEKPPVCPKSQLPQLHLTPSAGGPKKPDNEIQTGSNNPWLLKPQPEIPATPPPQTKPQPLEFFPH